MDILLLHTAAAAAAVAVPETLFLLVAAQTAADADTGTEKVAAAEVVRVDASWAAVVLDRKAKVLLEDKMAAKQVLRKGPV